MPTFANLMKFNWPWTNGVNENKQHLICVISLTRIPWLLADFWILNYSVSLRGDYVFDFTDNKKLIHYQKSELASLGCLKLKDCRCKSVLNISAKRPIKYKYDLNHAIIYYIHIRDALCFLLWNDCYNKILCSYS